MFNLRGGRSPTSVAAESVLTHCGLEVDGTRNDSFAIVLYRRDPLDNDLYLTAFAGLRELEPMFGLLRWDDFRRADGSNGQLADSFGFRQREGTKWCRSIRRNSWLLYINGRQRKSRAEVEERILELEERLAAIVAPDPPASGPLFPKLWYTERAIRDQLQDVVHDQPPGTCLEDVAGHITQVLSKKFDKLIGGAGASAGIYLDTDDEWRLCGTDATRPWVTQSVEKRDCGEHAFSWVAQSTRPALIRPDMSERWRERVFRCGPDFVSSLRAPAFGGIALVPILHGPRRAKSFAILLLAAHGAPLTPAHMFLLCRLSRSLSGYLFPLLPLPGFPWWPEAKLRRGGAEVNTVPSRKRATQGVPRALTRLARDIARDLMPKDSHVQLSPLRWGQSGALVFRLDVQDEKKVTEVPRVMKLGAPNLIRKELNAYFRYAHNKSLGSYARVDIARSSLWPVGTEHAEWFGDESPEAIVYMLAGAGDVSMPWSQWAKTSELSELRRGLDLLKEQLRPWYVRSCEACASKSVIDLMLDPLAHGRLQTHLPKGSSTVPKRESVQRKINVLSRLEWPRPCRTCIVHGDLHADNIFAILDSGNRIKSVAMIDWGNVQSGWHPLSDISKLMVDLVYRVRYCEDVRSLARDTVKQWGDGLAEPWDWAVALVHQIAKIMFYVDISSGKPYISENARADAWQDMLELSRELESHGATGKKRTSGRGARTSRRVRKASDKTRVPVHSSRSPRSRG